MKQKGILRHAATRFLGLIPTLLVLITIAFFLIRVAPGGPFDSEKALPPEIRAVLPDGTRVLGVHASPGCDDGLGLHPGVSRETVAQDLLLRLEGPPRCAVRLEPQGAPPQAEGEGIVVA